MINLMMTMHLYNADVHETHQAITSNDEKIAVEGNLTSGWLREMEALIKINLLRRQIKVRGQTGEKQATEIN